MSAEAGGCPGNLPAETTSFVGRRAELTETARLLGVSRLVTLTGPAGVGKSRLALRAAGTVQGLFPDGAWLVESAGVQDPSLLGHAVLEALGLADSTARRPDRALVEQLADRELLLVLDGCEHLVDTCAGLVDALLRAAPGVRVLATSRQELRVRGEHLLVLAPLPVAEEGAVDGASAAEDAVRLFADRAAAVPGGFRVTAENRAAVAAVCRRLDGIPLAVELAAGRLRALSVEQIAERLDDRFRLLTGGSRTALPRHRTLRTAIGWSHELCTPQERLLWARLSVFADGFDLDAAEYVCPGGGIEAEEVLEVLSELVAKSVVVREAGSGGARYRMLDTVREYGAWWLRSLGEEGRMRRRHRDWYLGLATWGEVEWFSARQAETGDRTRLAHANLRVALDFCVTEPGEEQSALHLAGTLWFYWVGCGHLGEGRLWLDRALALAHEPTQARAKALWVTGYMATLQGDLRHARPLLEECRQQAVETGDDLALAYAVHRQGCAALIGDEPARAAVLFEEALWHYEKLGELNSNVLMAMFELGLAAVFQGDTATGERWMERVRDLCEEYGERWAYAYGLYAMAYSEWQLGEVGAARAHARECVRLNHLFRDLVGVVLGLEMLALLTTEPGADGASGDLREARLLQGAAHRLWQAVGIPLFGSRHFRAPHDECAARAEAGLTEHESAEAFRVGSALGLDAAVARALEGPAAAEKGEPPQRCALRGLGSAYDA
ncbi:ATP-binding protein [Peterkaempfera griseoplana]|uniref:ATP-binding protein n=1 Tax=Peterkaempfera griseoplana TaxID=66896 RepID=UPI000A7E75F4|nr:regulator [Peterkaempfera griseoplana]